MEGSTLSLIIRCSRFETMAVYFRCESFSYDGVVGYRVTLSCGS